MSDFSLQAISPIDGRYSRHTKALVPYFSEEALIKYRVHVEIEYFIQLMEIPLPQLADIDRSIIPALQDIHLQFSTEDARRIKEIEGVTNHDVKAVEYFIKEQFDKLGLADYKEFIHFGLTSQDINNTAIPMSLRDAVQEVYIPALFEVMAKLRELAEDWDQVSMLARTHGQPASPTRLGKEIRDRHEGRADDAEAVFDAVLLQNLHEGFFGVHLHRCRSLAIGEDRARLAPCWFGP